MAEIRFSGRRAHGVTLIEMLVVIGIMVMLMGISIPLMSPAMEGRRIREASRQVNVYLGSARNHAMATNRSVGVVIKPFEGLTQCSMTLDQVECPPPYSGDTLSSYARVQAAVSGGKQTGAITATLTDFNPALVSVSDLVQFGHQGPFYIITAAPTATQIQATFYNVDLTAQPQAQLLPWPSGAPSCGQTEGKEMER